MNETTRPDSMTYLATTPDPSFPGGKIIGDAGENFDLAIAWADEAGSGARVVRQDLWFEERIEFVTLYEVP